jgi:hypothetical protein
MSEHLHHKLAVLHENLLHGKLPRSMRWADAVELVEHLGKVQPQGGDEFAFTIGAERELFRRPRGADLGIDEVSRLRKFLKTASGESAESQTVQSRRTIVVIDHHAARVFQDMNLSRPASDVAIKPYDPHHFHHHLIHRKEAHYEGDRVPEESSFYREIAEALAPAKEIILIGHAVGKSSAVDVLIDYLKKHHSDIAERVKATQIADLSALTEPQIEALARKVASGDHGGA